jgi:hypothetical protein
MMLYYADYYNYTFAVNETTRKLFVTGMVNEVITTFQKKIKADSEDSPGDIYKDLKWYFYSDHDDSSITMSTAFGHHLDTYPPFATQIVFELLKNSINLSLETGEKSVDGKYFVKMKINDKEIPLWGSCKGQLICEFPTFEQGLAR